MMRCCTFPHLSLSLTRRFISNSRPLQLFNNLNYSAPNGILQKGNLLHAHIQKTGQVTPSLHYQLFTFYVINQELCSASKLFEEMPNRDVVSYNKLIYVISSIHRGLKRDIIDLVFSCLRIMLEGNVKPDRITYTGLFKICVDMKYVVGAKMLHCRVFKEGKCEDRFIIASLVNLYGKFGLVQDAKSVFDCALRRDLVCLNVMISSYAMNYMCKEAFEVYHNMQISGYKGDDFTITSLLKATATVESYDLGRQIHGTLCKQGLDVDVVVASALIDMYAKVLCIVDARKAFDEMVVKNRISWTTMIVGYGRCSDGKEATKLLRHMLHACIVPDELTLASVVSSCGNVSMIVEIDEVHIFSMKTGYLNFTSVGNALVSAYSKCGRIDLAVQCFYSIRSPDLVSWTSMIGGFAYHGFPDKAVEYFENMLLDGIKPDRLSFLQVLCACTHGGNVDKGIHYFTLMVEGYNLVPQSEHYTCLVDLLGRAGLLNEALNILISMPVKPGPDAFAAFLGSCKVNEKFELAKWATEKLLELEPAKAVNHTLMSNVYSSIGSWTNAAIVRETMPHMFLKKTAGCSRVEIADKTRVSVSCETF